MTFYILLFWLTRAESEQGSTFHFEEDIKLVHRSLYIIFSKLVKLKIFVPFEMTKLNEKIFFFEEDIS
jgi:hypothetical protein